MKFPAISVTGKRLMTALLLCALLLPALPVTALANSAEPPSLVIIVTNPPADLTVALAADNEETKAAVRHTAWEGYYVFYTRDLNTSWDYTFKVTANGESFSCAIEKPLEGYNNIYTLNLEKRELTPGEAPFRTALLVAVRVLLTLLLEGAVFWLFGFRQKRSWGVFLFVNLVTQGILNLWLLSGGSPVQGYLVIALALGEFFVFVSEMVFFAFLLDEHKKSRILVCTFTANLVSLFLGGWLITVLPV